MTEGECRQVAFNILSQHPGCIRDDVVLNDLIEEIGSAIYAAANEARRLSSSPQSTGERAAPELREVVAVVLWHGERDSSHRVIWAPWGMLDAESRDHLLQRADAAITVANAVLRKQPTAEQGGE